MESGCHQPLISSHFDRQILPYCVTAGIHRLDVRPYVPPPLRCYNCQRFGHTQERCRSEQKCSCGSPPHGDDPCPDPPKCINCGLAHSCRSRNCPTYKREVQIQTIKTSERLSYSEAKKRVPTAKTSETTYAQVAQVTPSLSTEIGQLIQQITPTIVAIIETNPDGKARYTVPNQGKKLFCPLVQEGKLHLPLKIQLHPKL